MISEVRSAASSWQVLSATSMGVALAGISSSSVSVALPTIVRSLHATTTDAVWFMLSYMVVNTIMILIFGRLADIVGRRVLYEGGLGIFILSSVLCGFATNPAMMEVLRGIQGLGAAVVITNTSALIADVFPRSRLSVGLGVNVSVASVAQVAGPLVGGFVVDGLGWRWLFWVNLPLGAIALVWTHLVLPKGSALASHERFDWAGAILLAGWMGGGIIALSFGGVEGWLSAVAISSVGTFVLGISLFVWLERRTPKPLANLGILNSRAAAAPYICAFLAAFYRYSAVVTVSLYLQSAGGLVPSTAGLIVGSLALGMAMSSPVAGILARRVDLRAISCSGSLLSACGLAAIAVFGSESWPPILYATGLWCVGCGTGLFMTPNTTAIMMATRADQVGVANGLRSSMQNTGYVISTALSLVALTWGLSPQESASAYAGTVVSLGEESLAYFSRNFRLIFAGMAAIAIITAIVSMMRPRIASVAGAPAGAR